MQKKYGYGVSTAVIGALLAFNAQATDDKAQEICAFNACGAVYCEDGQEPPAKDSVTALQKKAQVNVSDEMLIAQTEGVKGMYFDALRNGYMRQYVYNIVTEEENNEHVELFNLRASVRALGLFPDPAACLPKEPPSSMEGLPSCGKLSEDALGVKLQERNQQDWQRLINREIGGNEYYGRRIFSALAHDILSRARDQGFCNPSPDFE